MNVVSEYSLNSCNKHSTELNNKANKPAAKLIQKHEPKLKKNGKFTLKFTGIAGNLRRLLVRGKQYSDWLVLRPNKAEKLFQMIFLPFCPPNPRRARRCRKEGRPWQSGGAPAGAARIGPANTQMRP